MKTGEKWMLNFFQHFPILKELQCFLHHLIFAISSAEIMEGVFCHIISDELIKWFVPSELQ